MKTCVAVNSISSRYKLTLAGVLLLIALSAWAVTPVEEVKLLVDDGAPSDFFGFNVALSGDTAVIGANGVDDKSRDTHVSPQKILNSRGLIIA